MTEKGRRLIGTVEQTLSNVQWAEKQQGCSASALTRRPRPRTISPREAGLAGHDVFLHAKDGSTPHAARPLPCSPLSVTTVPGRGSLWLWFPPAPLFSPGTGKCLRNKGAQGTPTFRPTSSGAGEEASSKLTVTVGRIPGPVVTGIGSWTPAGCPPWVASLPPTLLPQARRVPSSLLLRARVFGRPTWVMANPKGRMSEINYICRTLLCHIAQHAHSNAHTPAGPTRTPGGHYTTARPWVIVLATTVCPLAPSRVSSRWRVSESGVEGPSALQSVQPHRWPCTWWESAWLPAHRGRHG